MLCPKADGGVLSRKGVVDYSIGKGVAPGVFVIAEMAHPRVRERMHDLKLGPGPYYTFYRPYHLTSLEVPLSCARAVLYKTADMQPLDVPSAEVCAVAKKDLEPGERARRHRRIHLSRLDHDGAKTPSRDKAVPCGLLEGGKVTKPIRKGELLTYDNCAVDAAAAHRGAAQAPGRHAERNARDERRRQHQAERPALLPEIQRRPS